MDSIRLRVFDRELHPEELRRLLDEGLDPNIRNYYGRTALIYATINDRLDIVRLLLEYNADPNITDDEGDTAL